MTTPSPELAAYQARPFLAYVASSHFSGGFRFDTEAEAVDYLLQQFARVRRIIRNREYGPSWVNFDCYRSYLEGPGGRVAARFVLFCDKLESH
jgi:hypothetical protein